MLAFIVRRLTISGFKDPRFPIVNCWTHPWEYMGIPCQLWLNVACGNGCRGGNGGCSSSDGNNGGVSDGGSIYSCNDSSNSSLRQIIEVFVAVLIVARPTCSDSNNGNNGSVGGGGSIYSSFDSSNSFIVPTRSDGRIQY